jgi:hypothetical protein
MVMSLLMVAYPAYLGSPAIVFAKIVVWLAATAVTLTLLVRPACVIAELLLIQAVNVSPRSSSRDARVVRSGTP